MPYYWIAMDTSPFEDPFKLDVFAASLSKKRRDHILSPKLSSQKAGRAACERGLIRLAKEAGIPYSSLCLGKRETGKPFLLNFPHVPISFSHDGHLGATLLAVGEIGDTKTSLGIDIQKIQSSNSHRDLVARFFPPAYQELYQTTTDADKPRVFSLLWTRLEAAGKADGRGLGLCLKDSTFPDAFHFRSWLCEDALGTLYALSVCANVNIFCDDPKKEEPPLAIPEKICYNRIVKNGKETLL